MVKSFGKKLLTGILSVSMMVTMGACGGNRNGSGKVSGEADKSGKLSIAIWDNAQKPGLDKIVAEFTKATGYQAEIQVITWDSYWTLLEAGASGGDMPDVFWMHSNEVQKYMQNNILLDLTEQLTGSDQVELDKFPEDIRALYEYDGKIYAMPKDIDTIALWYNKTMFDEAGMDYPDESWIWDDYYDTAVKLTKDDGSQYGTAMNPSNEQDGWMNIVYSMGGYIISDDKKTSGFDNPNTIRAMEFVDKLINDAMPPAAVMAETGTDVLLASGKIAMLPQGSWMLAGFMENEYISQNCDVAVLPKDAQTGRRVSIYNGLGWAASANTKNPDAARALIEWFGTKEMQLMQAELGVTMAAYEGVSDAWVNSVTVFNLQPYLEMTKDTVLRPYSRATLKWWIPMQTELKEVWSGNADMREVCLKIAAQMSQILAEE